MKERVIKFLKEEKNVINVQSFNQFCKILDYLKYLELKSGPKYNYNDYKNKTTISYGFVVDNVGLGDIDFHKKNGYSIVNFDKFSGLFISNDKKYHLYLAKQRVAQLEKEIEEETKKYYVRLKDIGIVRFDARYNFFSKFLHDNTYFFDNNEDKFNIKKTFTKQELINLKIWGNELFDFEEVTE